jgi:hypothetical protein
MMMSEKGPEPDIKPRRVNVAEVPRGDIRNALNELVRLSPRDNIDSAGYG